MIGKGLAVVAVCAGVAAAQGDPARAFDAATAAVRKPGTTVRVDLIGDSTQTDNAGYGRGFCANLSAKVDCLNMAKGGASTRTYREQGLWDRALATKPDYMVIQFGHNDMVDPKNPMPRQVPLPDYIANLKRFVTEARAAGITPVLCTPLTRRYFEPGRQDPLRPDRVQRGDARSGEGDEGAADRIAGRQHRVSRQNRRGRGQQARDHQEGRCEARPSSTRRIWTGRAVMSLGGSWRSTSARLCRR